MSHVSFKKKLILKFKTGRPVLSSYEMVCVRMCHVTNVNALYVFREKDIHLGI